VKKMLTLLLGGGAVSLSACGGGHNITDAANLPPVPLGADIQCLQAHSSLTFKDANGGRVGSGSTSVAVIDGDKTIATLDDSGNATWTNDTTASDRSQVVDCNQL